MLSVYYSTVPTNLLMASATSSEADEAVSTVAWGEGHNITNFSVTQDLLSELGNNQFIRMQVPEIGLDVEFRTGAPDPTSVPGYQNDIGATTWASFVTNYLVSMDPVTTANLLAAGVNIKWKRKEYAVDNSFTYTAAKNYTWLFEHLPTSATTNTTTSTHYMHLGASMYASSDSAGIYNFRTFGLQYPDIGTNKALKAKTAVIQNLTTATSANVIAFYPNALTGDIENAADGNNLETALAMNGDGVTEENWQMDLVYESDIPLVPDLSAQAVVWTLHDSGGPYVDELYIRGFSPSEAAAPTRIASDIVLSEYKIIQAVRSSDNTVTPGAADWLYNVTVANTTVSGGVTLSVDLDGAYSTPVQGELVPLTIGDTTGVASNTLYTITADITGQSGRVSTVSSQFIVVEY